MTRVGVLGLGRMGLPIARNLLDKGFEVIGYQRRPSPDLISAGGTQADSPADLAARADVLLSILPDIDAVRAVVSGPEGTLKSLRPGTVHIEMSTIDVAEKAKVRDLVQQASGDLLDAPISGSPSMVPPRLATTFASGKGESIDAVADVLAAISGPWVRAGEFGSGAHFKYIANLLLAVHTVAAAEAMSLADKAGLDLELVQRTLDESIAGSMVWKRFGPRIRSREWLPAPGPIETLHEILVQIDAYKQEVGSRTPMFDVAKALYDDAMAHGRGHLDVSSVRDQLTGKIGPHS
ncbi:NAD-binding protein [Amycolatopsis sp. RM579]|uniref:NAD-binding protein n=2 Tax=Amycolatopsis pithecellobii TaxID=664692 RepID=A0A6N7Z0Y2_9PSEU|nr:NAD-binding protein [Amycolatopsis pithecellobii]